MWSSINKVQVKRAKKVKVPVIRTDYRLKKEMYQDEPEDDQSDECQ